MNIFQSCNNSEHDASLFRISSVVLLPLDALKVKAQTSPEQLHGRGVVDIFRKEGFGLYRGAGLTVMRNAPGKLEDICLLVKAKLLDLGFAILNQYYYPIHQEASLFLEEILQQRFLWV